jgi:hypothetical protein
MAMGYFSMTNRPEAVLDLSTEGIGEPTKEPASMRTPPRDDSSKPRDDSAQPSDQSGDLQRFASDFVRTDQTGVVGDQHRFYADSVHFYGEGDLSWARRGRDPKISPGKAKQTICRSSARGRKGPVGGGVYVVDQPVAWSRTDGSHLTHGRSTLRLRVVGSGRGGWKITSIEEVGP